MASFNFSFSSDKKNNPLAGMVIGIVMFIGSFFLISYNEGRALDAAEALIWAEKQTIAVATNQIDPANNGRFIAVQGEANVSDLVADRMFAVVAQDALRLQRKAEMYQWKESSSTSSNDRTTYSYSKTWSENAIDSSEFHDLNHKNPAMSVKSAWMNNMTGTLGVFRLTDQILNKLTDTRPFPLPENYQAPQNYRATDSNQLYRGADPADPQIGDIRVSFHVVPADAISIAGVQNGHVITQGNAPNRKFGILLAETGLKSVETLYANEQQRQSTLTWILRGVSFAIMWLGIYLLFSPLTWLANFVPYLGRLISTAAGTIAFVIALPLFVIAEVFFWFSVRPVLSIAMVAGACAIAAAVYMMSRNKTKTDEAPASPIMPS